MWQDVWKYLLKYSHLEANRWNGTITLVRDATRFFTRTRDLCLDISEKKRVNPITQFNINNKGTCDHSCAPINGTCFVPVVWTKLKRCNKWSLSSFYVAPNGRFNSGSIQFHSFRWNLLVDSRITVTLRENSYTGLSSIKMVSITVDLMSIIGPPIRIEMFYHRIQVIC